MPRKTLEKEKDIKKVILAYLKSIPNCSAFPISTMGVMQSNGRWRKTSMRPGTPDILVCYRGDFIGIEVKALNGKLSEHQAMVGNDIQQCGGRWLVAKSLDDVTGYFDTLRF